MNKEYVILLHGKTGGLIVNSNVAESNGDTVKFLKIKNW